MASRNSICGSDPQLLKLILLAYQVKDSKILAKGVLHNSFHMECTYATVVFARAPLQLSLCLATHLREPDPDPDLPTWLFPPSPKTCFGTCLGIWPRGWTWLELPNLLCCSRWAPVGWCPDRRGHGHACLPPSAPFPYGAVGPVTPWHKLLRCNTQDGS